MYVRLSYPLEAYVPAWLGTPQLQLEPLMQLSAGDVANTFLLHLHNHIGTHYNAPNHYVKDGLSISELPLEYFIFTCPLRVELPKGERELITAADLAPHREEIAGCDLLLLDTGFSRWRSEDPNKYESEGPGLSAEAAAWLVEYAPQLRAVAVDFVSLASYRAQDDGNEAHRTLFRGKNGHFICGIEDVDLNQIRNKCVKRVFAMPLWVRGIDSAPVSLLAEVE